MMLARVPGRMRRALASSESPPVLTGRRVRLRPLVPSDFAQWREVRGHNGAWLTRWEPAKPKGAPDPDVSRSAFAARCGARDRERHLGTGYGFGVFVDGTLVGEMNVAGVTRGPFQSCHVGYWIDQRHAGNGYIPEAVVAGLRFAFEELDMHRVEIAIVPRNERSRRVVEKLALRSEGVALRFLEINGCWEDHERFAITAEEWAQRRDGLVFRWL